MNGPSLVVMGVSGCSKSSLGAALRDRAAGGTGRASEGLVAGGLICKGVSR